MAPRNKTFVDYFQKRMCPPPHTHFSTSPKHSTTLLYYSWLFWVVLSTSVSRDNKGSGSNNILFDKHNRHRFPRIQTRHTAAVFWDKTFSKSILSPLGIVDFHCYYSPKSVVWIFKAFIFSNCYYYLNVRNGDLQSHG